MSSKMGQGCNVTEEFLGAIMCGCTFGSLCHSCFAAQLSTRLPRSGAGVPAGWGQESGGLLG